MKDKVLRFCREQRLLPPGSHVVCAVSGGADSMAMLSCLLSLREEADITVSAVHFNHKLRGQESDADEQFVREFCRIRDIPLICSSGDAAAYAKEHRLSVEEAARALRYQFFSGLDGLIATAHTADDNAETVLMNLLRGTGLRGLGGIPPCRGKFVRPMLCVTREDVLQALQHAGITWREDSSNAGDDYRRNRLRHHVIPLLKQENPAFSKTVLEESLLLRQENEYLEQLAAEAAEAAQAENGHRLDVLADLPDALLRRTLLHFFREHEIPCDSGHVESLLRLIRSGNTSGRVGLPQDTEAVLSCGILRFCREPLPALVSRKLQIPGRTLIPECSMEIRCTLTDEIPAPAPDTVLLDHTRLTSTVTVRARMTGDELALPGGHRSLKRLMIDRKIPVTDRDRIPVLAMDNTVLAAYGLGTSQNYLPTPGHTVLAVQFIHTDRGERQP